MRIDVVSIFPGYFAPLDLSLIGKARRAGLLDVRVHDLRHWTHDRHRTVDDTPAGGGAGMVMKPEPWGEALDELVSPGSTPEDRPVLVVPGPAGERFTQQVAAGLAQRDHLVMACGRYEGIDQRVLDEAATRMEVRELSLGDYVLNGGEVAALAVLEAVVRLLPGFMGNAQSLVEESHTDGLLEYPVYTKPAAWRGRAVPDVLLSGDHERIARWRRAQSVRRTVERRPDLAHPARLLEVDELAGEVVGATRAEAGELLTLQRACWSAAPDATLLGEGLAEVEAALADGTTLVLRVRDRVVGAARGRRSADQWQIDRVMVAPDLQGRGVGRRLLEAVEAAAPDDVSGHTVVVHGDDERVLRLCRKAGYRPRGPQPDVPGTVRLGKRRAPATDFR